MLGGIAWIVLLSVVLTGVVAINVIVLKQNMELEGLVREQQILREQNTDLHSQLSKVASSVRVERLAQSRLGLVQVAPAETTYIRLSAGGT